MELYLLRRWQKQEYTIGEFSVNGVFWCNTVEDTVRKTKIKGKTAIPAGRYRVTITYSPKFKKNMPLINAVPNFTGIRIHSGVDANSTEGCIIPGENRLPGKVLNSPYWSNKIQMAIREAISRKEAVYITIKNTKEPI